MFLLRYIVHNGKILAYLCNTGFLLAGKEVALMRFNELVSYWLASESSVLCFCKLAFYWLENESTLMYICKLVFYWLEIIYAQAL